jgi:uncharacterized YigZ family protein
MQKDSYNTIKQRAEGLFKDKGSKFISFVFPISDVSEVKAIISKIKKDYHDARHHCFAYKIGIGEDCYRVNDDGEPSGTAGKPIYGQIVSNKLSDVLIVVVRYFGGTLLGVSGLINAYKNATASCISNSIITERIIKKTLQIKFKYDLVSKVMRVIKECLIDIREQDFTESCSMKLDIRTSEFQRIYQLFSDLYGVEIIDIDIDDEVDLKTL